ncbi:MAG: hypothetical protein LBG87_05535 [Spirochaetaceae bacterium]|nr:hypothetical protein [Spirochaetaceae bacterium]
MENNECDSLTIIQARCTTAYTDNPLGSYTFVDKYRYDYYYQCKNSTYLFKVGKEYEFRIDKYITNHKTKKLRRQEWGVMAVRDASSSDFPTPVGNDERFIFITKNGQPVDIQIHPLEIEIA